MIVRLRASVMRHSPYATFLASWLRSPAKVGAIAPSGRQLAAMMVKGIDPAAGPVVELGPGTGTFTAALAARGVAERDMILIEFNPAFARYIRNRFPGATVIEGDAALVDLRAVAGRPVQAVVSGLPLLSMPNQTVRGVLRAAFAGLPPDGALYQFTYGWRCPVPRRILGELDLEASRVGVALRNLPPASVYRVVRRGAAGSSAGRGRRVHDREMMFPIMAPANRNGRTR